MGELSQAAIDAAVAHCRAKSAWVRIQDDYRDGKITLAERKRLQEPNTKAWDESWAAWVAATEPAPKGAEGGEG